MRLRHLLSLSLLFASHPAHAQLLPADEFFHSGAQSYLTNNLAKAREEVDAGLKLYPDDIKLKKLDELLKQQQQQQSKNDQQKQDQDKKDQQQKQDQQKQNEQQQSKQDQQAKSGGEDKDKKDEKNDQSQQMQAHAMTPQEAKQLLDAQKGDEQVLVFRPQGEPKNRDKALNDW